MDEDVCDGDIHGYSPFAGKGHGSLWLGSPIPQVLRANYFSFLPFFVSFVFEKKNFKKRLKEFISQHRTGQFILGGVHAFVITMNANSLEPGS
ncbi:hypothetical protein EUGRSUZ_D01320 [Eucalyptus grandis]|uniref:Uncharacterized protein n=2 Tax=Eucalyptus grandis TaxID=71139 RepID=A0ACC3L4A7_EUCGR|nr:hypothetical protein EUGRSUZ_D01320 [Eucalyptus grandis]